MKRVPIDHTQYVGKYYSLASNIENYYTRRWRMEVIKVVKTQRGWRVVCLRHWKWPIQSTQAFSLSVNQLKARVDSGQWVLDVVASDPAYQLSEGL